MLLSGAMFDSACGMDHQKLIADLGGPHELQGQLAARGVGLKQVTVRAWALEGRQIPAKYWTHVKAIADDRDVPVTFAGLARAVATPSTPEQDAAA